MMLYEIDGKKYLVHQDHLYSEVGALGEVPTPAKVETTSLSLKHRGGVSKSRQEQPATTPAPVHHHAKQAFTEAEIANIIELYKRNELVSNIAKKFNKTAAYMSGYIYILKKKGLVQDRKQVINPD